VKHPEYQMRLTNFMERTRKLFPQKELVSIEADGEIVRYTYLDEYRRVCQLANALKDLGTKRGDVVGAFAWNTHRYGELYYAVPCMGATLHTINVRLSDDDIIYMIEEAKDNSLVFIEEDLIPRFEPIAKKLKNIKGYVILSKKKDIKDLPETSLSPVYLYEDLISQASSEYEFPEDLDENTPATITYTGGTTGRPKGMVFSHRNIFLIALAFTSAEYFGICQKDAILNLPPLFHNNGWYLPHAARLTGAKQVYPGRRVRPEVILSLVEQEKITFSAAVPTTWLDCLKLLKSGEKKYDISSLRLVFVGGAAMPRRAMKEYDQMGVKFAHVYGAAEASLISGAFLRPELENLSEEEKWEKRASVGYFLPCHEFKVVHEDGTEIKWDGKDRGEAIARGPWTMTSYLKAPEQSAETFKDGWYHSGDIVTVDEYGYINVVDRVKDVIKSGGEYISSIDLEGACMEHPAVAEACAIGVEHERWTERPILIIIPHEKYREKINKGDILDFLSSKVPKWWLPDEIIFTDTIPRTGVGKFDKRALREKYSNVLLDEK